MFANVEYMVRCITNINLKHKRYGLRQNDEKRHG